jgi:hypothetical protein
MAGALADSANAVAKRHSEPQASACVERPDNAVTFLVVEKLGTERADKQQCAG